MNLLNSLFDYVIFASKKHNIDESHSLGHSMNVLNFANKIYENELINNPYLEKYKRIIYCSAILHDMCDKKYMDESVGVSEIKQKLSDDNLLPIEEINVILKIISNMSYSKVKKIGYTDLGEHQIAFHIVREADLLSAYQIERCIIFQMMQKNNNYLDSFEFAKKLFDERVFKHLDDELFVTKYSKNLALKLHKESIDNIKNFESIKL